MVALSLDDRERANLDWGSLYEGHAQTNECYGDDSSTVSHEALAKAGLQITECLLCRCYQSSVREENTNRAVGFLEGKKHRYPPFLRPNITSRCTTQNEHVPRHDEYSNKFNGKTTHDQERPDKPPLLPCGMNRRGCRKDRRSSCFLSSRSSSSSISLMISSCSSIARASRRLWARRQPS